MEEKVLLSPEVLREYKKDLEMLELLLSGTYEKSYQAIIKRDIRAMANIAGYYGKIVSPIKY